MPGNTFAFHFPHSLSVSLSLAVSPSLSLAFLIAALATRLIKINCLSCFIWICCVSASSLPSSFLPLHFIKYIFARLISRQPWIGNGNGILGLELELGYCRCAPRVSEWAVVPLTQTRRHSQSRSRSISLSWPHAQFYLFIFLSIPLSSPSFTAVFLYSLFGVRQLIFVACFGVVLIYSYKHTHRERSRLRTRSLLLSLRLLIVIIIIAIITIVMTALETYKISI